MYTRLRFISINYKKLNHNFAIAAKSLKDLQTSKFFKNNNKEEAFLATLYYAF